VNKIVSGSKSYQNCSICGATPKQMNDIKRVSGRKIYDEVLDFGLSPLHARIRTMEMVLKISRNSGFKRWSVRGKPLYKTMRLSAKLRIQRLLKKQLGLYVDFPRASGSGSSNDGNTARRFFKNYEKVAQITGFDCDLLRRFKVLLDVLNSGKPIDSDKFQKYALDTAKLYVQKYKWYFMPQTVHKYLMHGKQVIEHHSVSIGTLSEEAQEHRNKDFKRLRRDSSRKFSREASNLDIFHGLCISSDPLISGLRSSTTQIKSEKTLDEESLSLLKI
jgi:hypothetical protein